MERQWKDKIFEVGAGNFEELSLELFHFQYLESPVYRDYVDALGVDPSSVLTLESIPFLPIRFFKSHEIKSTIFQPETSFESSGTTGTVNSRHLVRDTGLYRDSFLRSFDLFYGRPSDWCILGLLPSYLERNNSSLVYMVDQLVRDSGHPDSGFYLQDFDKLASTLRRLEDSGQPTLLIGVSFALLDFAESYPMPLQHTRIMETGGMKGRRKELIRAELHDHLKRAFQVEAIHSEYGMTELLSQAYSDGAGIFRTPPWMKVLTRDDEDPLDIRSPHPQYDRPITGALNIIDLANVYSSCFIATDDAVKIYPDTSFEVLGRMDNSDLRGCSLLVL